MEQNLTVVYNDTCPICAREVAGYRRLTQRHGLNLGFDGLSDCDLARYGLTPEQAARRFHVMQQDGTLLSGIDAFAALWARMPGFGWLGRLVSLPGLHGVCVLLYDHVLAPALYAMHRRRVARGTLRKIA